jgi:hypothetical protein
MASFGDVDLTPYQHTETVTVACSPEEAHAIVSDVSRMGELSPVCTGGAFDDASATGAGSWFTGSNAIGDFTWETRCRVEVNEPGKEFSFTNFGPDGQSELVRWGYTFESAGGGTEVTEHWQILPGYVPFTQGGDETKDITPNLDGMAAMARDGMAASLAKLKELAGS